MEQKIIIAGGSGFIGRSLTKVLADRGDEVVVLSRDATRAVPGARVVPWDGRTVGDWAGELEGAFAVVNLAGKNVSCIYTQRNRIAMNRSRVNAVRAMGAAINQCRRRPRVLVQASTTAVYGDRGDEWLEEGAFPGDGYPTETSLLWEHAFEHTPTPGVRRVLLRISFVLGADGGALGHLRRLTRCFLGGTVGSGKQYISWIHQQDLNAQIICAIDDDRMAGMYHVTGLNPVTNGEFMRVLRRVMRRPWSPPTPALLVQVGAPLMNSAAVLALTGRRVRPRRFLDAGFEYAFADVETALRDLLEPAAIERESSCRNVPDASSLRSSASA